MKIIEGKLKIDSDKKIAIINARFNHIITDRLVEGAVDAFLRHGGDENNLNLILVPGAFEIPFALDKILASKKYDGVCCVGAIIRGSTPHFEYVASEVAKGIAQVSLEKEIPVIFGILTTDTIEQAIERAGTKSGNKGFDAAMTFIETANLLNNL